MLTSAAMLHRAPAPLARDAAAPAQFECIRRLWQPALLGRIGTVIFDYRASIRGKCQLVQRHIHALTLVWVQPHAGNVQRMTFRLCH